jgi:hypothetical protein
MSSSYTLSMLPHFFLVPLWLFKKAVEAMCILVLRTQYSSHRFSYFFSIIRKHGFSNPAHICSSPSQYIWTTKMDFGAINYGQFCYLWAYHFCTTINKMNVVVMRTCVLFLKCWVVVYIISFTHFVKLISF